MEFKEFKRVRINEFVDSSSEWAQVYKVDFNHGLIVLEKTA